MRILSMCAFLTALIASAVVATQAQEIRSCANENESLNSDVDIAAMKHSVEVEDWAAALQALTPKSRFDPALCVEGLPIITSLLYSYFDDSPYEMDLRSLMMTLLERGVDPNTVVESTDGDDEGLPAPLALVLLNTPYDVALVRALLIGGHGLTNPQVPGFPTYLHILPEAYRVIRQTVVDRVSQGLYLIRHGKASNLEDALNVIAEAHVAELKQCQEDSVRGVTENISPSTKYDPRVAMDGLFESSMKFQDIDFQLLFFLYQVSNNKNDPKKLDRSITYRQVATVAAECLRYVMALLLHSPHVDEMLAADQLNLVQESTGYNMLHAMVATGDVQLLGPFVDELKARLVDAIFHDEFAAPADASLHSIDDSEFDFEDDYDESDDDEDNEYGASDGDEVAEVPVGAETADTLKTASSAALSSPEVQSLRKALTAKDGIFQRTPLHYAATLDAKMVGAVRDLVAVAMGGDGLGNNGASSSAIAAERAGFPELYGVQDTMGETIERYMKLYNTEAMEGERPIEEAPAHKSEREVVEQDEARLIPSERESVNRVMLTKRTFYARKELAKQQKRLEAILNKEPVGRVLDSHDPLMYAFTGPTTYAQLKDREEQKKAAYIDYDDEEMVAQEIAMQEQRVQEAQDKLDEYLETAKLPELPKPEHMTDPHLVKKLEALGPEEKGTEIPKQEIRPSDVAGCDITELPIDEFEEVQDILTHLILSESPIVLRGPYTASDTDNHSEVATGWAYGAFVRAGGSACNTDRQECSAGTRTMEIDAIASALTGLLQDSLLSNDIQVHTQPRAIGDLPPSLIHDADQPRGGEHGLEKALGLLPEDNFTWITDGTTCHVAVSDELARQCGHFVGIGAHVPVDHVTLSTPGSLTSHDVIHQSPEIAATVETIARGILSKTVHNPERISSDEGIVSELSELLKSTTASYGGPGSGQHVSFSDAYSIVFQLDGVQNWAVIPPLNGLASAETPLSFFKETLPEIYDTEISMCALRPGDVLLLPPRHARGSFRATESLDLAFTLPGLAIPHSKDEETSIEEE